MNIGGGGARKPYGERHSANPIKEACKLVAPRVGLKLVQPRGGDKLDPTDVMANIIL